MKSPTKTASYRNWAITRFKIVFVSNANAIVGGLWSSTHFRIGSAIFGRDVSILHTSYFVRFGLLRNVISRDTKKESGEQRRWVSCPLVRRIYYRKGEIIALFMFFYCRRRWLRFWTRSLLNGQIPGDTWFIQINVADNWKSVFCVHFWFNGYCYVLVRSLQLVNCRRISATMQENSAQRWFAQVSSWETGS